MPDRRYYRPVSRGLEIKIGEALARLRVGQGAAGSSRTEPPRAPADPRPGTDKGTAD
jgi:hypothetical protein